MVKRLLAFALLALVLGTDPAQAGGVKSLYLDSEFDSTISQTTFNNIIGSDVRFDQANSAVYSYSISGNPTLAYMSQFDSILFSANYQPNTPLLDSLADYVDGGGHVVLTTFTGYYEFLSVTGRILTSGYNPLTGPTTDAYNPASLGTQGRLGSRRK